ncbi:MAG TPA: hypothetical protein VFP44_10550 [Usitatibacter sp.]|nr:hypothetical protein [Usitatibacter sp.]
MKTCIALTALATAALAAATAFAESPEPPAAVNVEGLPTHVRLRILEKAQEGQTSVIRYLHRTYAVHRLRAEQVLKEQQPVFAAKDGVKVAGSDEAPRK